MCTRFAPALDLTLETLLRMDVILDHAWKKEARAVWGSIAEAVRGAVPAALWNRLPLTSQRCGGPGGAAATVPKAKAQQSLLSAEASLRPAWMRRGGGL